MNCLLPSAAVSVSAVCLHAAFVPGYLRFGQLHVPVYGLFAAAGLMAALFLSQRTAKLAGLPPEKLWDAGMLAVLAAFVASRVLLVVADPAAFMRYPLLVLELPSLTYSGILLTALLTWGWLRWKRLPVLDVADAWAPCGALIWAVLSLGHFVEGTDAGMPTHLPWGVTTPGDTVLDRVQPAQLYALAAGLALCAFLLWRLAHRQRAGEIAGFGLIAGGAASFLIGMVRQPAETFGDAWLDPAQYAALAMVLAGGCIRIAFRQTPAQVRLRVGAFLEEFIQKRGRMQTRWLQRAAFTDPLLVEVQERFFRLRREYPTDSKDLPWCNEQGLEVLKWYAWQLRSEAPQSAIEETR